MINRHDFVTNFVSALEYERSVLGYTQREMASRLQMSITAYKNLVAGQTMRIDFYTVYLLSVMTGKLAGEFIGDTRDFVRTGAKYRTLSQHQKDFVDHTTDFLN